MHPRASELIELLDLKPYREGGYFAEVFRSSVPIRLTTDHEERKALTTMYYLLTAGEYEGWHLLSGDEVWHYHEGDPLELFWIKLEMGSCSGCLLGQAGELSKPVAVVPGGYWRYHQDCPGHQLVQHL